MDDFGHGTHCAGIVAANGTIKGVAPDASLYAYKVLNQNGSGMNSDIIAAWSGPQSRTVIKLPMTPWM